MLNNIIIMGRLTADPELRITDNSQYCKFSIATARPKKKNEETAISDFFNCVSWGGIAKIVNMYYHKGDIIVLSGHLRNNSFEKDGKLIVSNEILVREIHFTNEKKSESQELPPETVYSETNLPF